MLQQLTGNISQTDRSVVAMEILIPFLEDWAHSSFFSSQRGQLQCSVIFGRVRWVSHRCYEPAPLGHRGLDHLGDLLCKSWVSKAGLALLALQLWLVSWSSWVHDCLLCKAGRLVGLADCYAAIALADNATFLLAVNRIAAFRWHPAIIAYVIISSCGSVGSASAP